MKSTPFTNYHIELGAKMAPFAGYNMPISYTSINEEHNQVRNKAGVFDVSHMGELLVKGKGSLELIQRLTTNDASKLHAGKAQYSCLTNEAGGIIDDLLVYCLKPGEEYMLVVNASNIEKDWNWISTHNHHNVELQNISEQTCLLAVQGPAAIKTILKLTDVDLLQLPYYCFGKGSFAGVPDVLISTTGYTGSGGVEIYFEDRGDAAAKIWTAIMKTGIPPIGLAARDTLRLEKGFCLYGNDIDDTTTPLEAGLGWVTKFTKSFTAKEILMRQKAAGPNRKLVAFELIDKGIPRGGYAIKDQEGAVIGKVTSGTQSPSLGKAIGLGYVQAPFAKEGFSIYVEVRGKALWGKIVNLPFF